MDDKKIYWKKMEAGIPASIGDMRAIIHNATGHDPGVMGLIIMKKNDPDMFPAAYKKDLDTAHDHIVNTMFDNMSFNQKKGAS